MKHIVSYSGGLGSYLAAKRVIKQHGIENTILQFAETYMEDDDLYRFLAESINRLSGNLTYELPDIVFPKLGTEERKKAIDDFFEKELASFSCFVRLVDGRDVWEVLNHIKALNSKFDKCSKFLKRDKLWRWVKKNYKPDECIVYLGIDWSEIHRLEFVKKTRKPYIVKAPLCQKPYLSKKKMYSLLSKDNIKLPKLYQLDFVHNNCGGFCIKAGQKQFKNLLEKLPERFVYHEAKEKEFQEKTGKTNTILKKMVKGDRGPYSLEEFRKDIEAKKAIDEQDWGGCGCAID